MINRRNFLQLSSMGVISAAIPEFLNPSIKLPRHRLSVQLYTLRKEIEKDIKGSLKRLAEIGFKNVETAFWPKGITDQVASDYLKEFGLSVSSCHCDVPTVDNLSDILQKAKAYDCQRMIWHGWPQDKRYSNLAGTKELIGIYNQAQKLASDQGLSFGLHNHWWEYRNRVADKLVYEILNEELHEDIFFETDIYWVKTAGHDPSAIIKKLKNRVQLLHVKDGPAVWSEKLATEAPDPMSPTGQGSLNIPSVINACSKQVQWLVVEIDEVNMDVFDALKQSFDYLAKFPRVSLT